MLAHSQAPSEMIAPVNRAKPAGGRKKMPPIAIGARISAVIIRIFNTSMVAVSLLLCGAGGDLVVGLAEPALAPGIGFQCLLHLVDFEIGPEHPREVKLRVGQLPQQEVTDALLAGGADKQVRHGQVTDTQVLLDQVISDI